MKPLFQSVNRRASARPSGALRAGRCVKNVGLVLGLVFALFFLGGECAWAHRASDAYLQVSQTNQIVHVRWDAAVRDLDHVLQLDRDDDGAVTWRELREQHPRIAAYAAEHLKFKVNGQALDLMVADQAVAERTDGVYAVLQATLTPRLPPRELVVEYTAFFEQDPLHRGIGQIAIGEPIHATVFAPDNPEQTFVLGQPNAWAEWVAFMREGVWHIWIGFDHVLFLMALLLPSVLRREQGRWVGERSLPAALVTVTKVVTAFTVAHSLTLAAAAVGWVSLPSRWVESVIAVSVVLAALHNLKPVWAQHGWVAAFGFGLIHGFGFAGVLGELGLPKEALALALIGFNVGVELGQLAIVLAFVPMAFLLRETLFYRAGVLRLGSLTIAFLAAIWVFERVWDRTVLSF